jgi:predicted DNA-binding ribbon-helix-helix protein
MDAKAARSSLVSRNVTISGHRTSVRLEPEMWSGLNEICRRERSTLHDICSRAAATDDGHLKVGHGLIGSVHNRDTRAGNISRPALRNMSAAASSSSSSSGAMSNGGSHNTGQNIGQATGQGMSQEMTQVSQQQARPSVPFMIGMSRHSGAR